MSTLLVLGILITLAGVAVLFYMAIKAKAISKLHDEDEKRAKISRLIILNFAGIGISTLGLVMVILNFTLFKT